MAWSAEYTPEILAMFQQVARAAPSELTLVGVLRAAPRAAWIDPAFHYKPIVEVIASYTGKVEEGEKLLAPVRAFGRPAGHAMRRRTYVSQKSLLEALQPMGRRYCWKSEYILRLSDGFLALAFEAARTAPSPHSAVVLFQLGGATGAPAAGPSAAGGRDPAFAVNLAAAWENPGDDGANIEWARAAGEALGQFSTGGTPGDIDRLARIKAKWDPGNMFQVNTALAPRA